ncbi:hypothetical protein SLEP1_g22900 [Rubroshorea leprosula]|uniref:Reverse transcriptase Ty1/copia-type domain-containing protein n=1 Tax=Rubroshorea leprosula TaxID=152421 RepID=A0AAV5JHX2_9ROSI|nr:hypothetical protein SLEP1_g22900 [Rubroshorea leprosula]
MPSTCHHRLETRSSIRSTAELVNYHRSPTNLSLVFPPCLPTNTHSAQPPNPFPSSPTNPNPRRSQPSLLKSSSPHPPLSSPAFASTSALSKSASPVAPTTYTTPLNTSIATHSPAKPNTATTSTSKPSSSPLPQPVRLHPMVTQSHNEIFKPKTLFLATKHPGLDPVKPSCVTQALKDPKGKQAMSNEHIALVHQGMWELVPPSPTQNIISCKWIFWLKRKADGSVECYKAHLVAKGFDQQYDCDYFDTFSPVTKPTTIRTVLTLVIVGSLQYLSLTRPDITYSVNKLSQFLHCPTELHWQAVKRLLQYLKGTSHHGLLIQTKSSLNLQGFSNSDWARDQTSFVSTTGYVLFLGLTSISWKATKQKAIARSLTEVEYCALAATSSEMVWVQNLLFELSFNISSPPTLYCDNLGATYLSSKPVLYSKMKHIAIDLHFVRDLVDKQVLCVVHISSRDQLPDGFTKPLSSTQFFIYSPRLASLMAPPSCGGVLRKVLLNPSIILDSSLFNL